MRHNRLSSMLNSTVRIVFIWLQKHLSKNHILLLFSVLVGISAGVAAVILKSLVHQVRALIVNNQNFQFQYSIYLLFPLIGILLTVWFTRVFLQGNLERGVANVLLAISRKSSLIPGHKVYTHILTSAITVGFGGSAGLESPIVVTGAAIGSNFGKLSFFNYKERTILLACGASAGIAAVFNAPVAGLLFSMEVLLTEVTVTAFIPLISASVAGVLCSKIILSEEILFSFPSLQPFDYHNVPFYIVLGILAGFTSVYYAEVSLKIEKLFHAMKDKVLLKAIIGGITLGLLVFLFPPLFGEGYESIKDLSQGKIEGLFQHSIYQHMQNHEWFILFFIGAIALIKVVATSLTLASGGNGGNFAPSLFVGAYVGFFFARLINMTTLFRIPEDNFTVVGMSGILAGVMYAPLTAVFLIAEITQGYNLMIPLMIVSAVSYILVRRIEAFSMDTRDLVRKGHLFTSNRDLNILRSLSLQDLIETNFHPVSPETTLRQIIESMAHSPRNIFPVIADNGLLKGIIVLDDMKELMFNREVYDITKAAQIMKPPPAYIHTHEDMASVMHKFDRTGAWNLPVINGERYVGFVSKSSIFMAYRKLLVHYYGQ